jgi:hypothetical protein
MTLIRLSLLALSLSACVRPLQLELLPCPCSEGWICCDTPNICVREGAICPTLDILPHQPKVSVGHSLQLSASQPVTWAVDQGTVDVRGLYLAPDEPGSYQLTATTTEKPTIQVSTTIEVVPLNVSLVAGQPGGRGYSDKKGTEARFGLVTSLVEDGAGHLYVADPLNQAIRKIDVATGQVSTVTGAFDPTRLYNGWMTRDGSLATASFYEPWTIVLDGTNLYVHDRTAIRKVDLAAGSVSTLAGGSPQTPGAFNDTFGALAFDGSRYLYLLWNYYDDYHEVRRLDVTTGEIVHVAGTRTAMVSDGVGAAASFGGLVNMVLLPSGNLVLCDRTMGTDPKPILRKLNPATAAVTTYPIQVDACRNMARAGDAICFYSDLRYQCNAEADLDKAMPFPIVGGGTFNTHFQTIAFGYGRFFGGRDGEVVQSLQHGPPFSTLAGASARAGSDDGSAGSARFSTPKGVALDDNEQRLFVSDTTNSTIRRVDLGTGWVTTLAGVVGLGSSVDGAASDARFEGPSDLCYANGKLYVAESKKIRAVDPDSGFTTTFFTVPDDQWLQQHACDGENNHLYTVSLVQTVVNGIGKLLYRAERIDLVSGHARTLVTVDASEPPMMVVARAGQVPYVLYPAIGQDKILVDEIDPGTAKTSRVLTSGPLWTALNGKGNSRGSPVRLSLDTRGRIHLARGSTLHRLDVASGAVTLVLGDWAHQGLALGQPPAGLNSAGGLAISRTGDLFISDSAENAILLAR